MWKRLLKLGQGPRPDLEERRLHDEQADAKDDGAPPQQTSARPVFEKGIRQVRGEAKARAQKGAAEQNKAAQSSDDRPQLELEAKDKLAIILALLQIFLPVALAALGILAAIIWLLGKFWLRIY